MRGGTISVYAQYGYGKANHIEDGLSAGVIQGVILGARDEDPLEMTRYAKALRKDFGKNVSILFDPQFYVSTLTAGRERHLLEYPYYSPGLSRTAFDPMTTVRVAESVVEFERGLGVDRIIAPSVLLYGFNDSWSQISISMGQAAIQAANRLKVKQPVLLTLIVDEPALTNERAIDEFLDSVTSLEAHGFYIIVNPSRTEYPPQYSPQTLGNLMYLCYVLADVNEFEVVCGYTDLVTVLLRTVGVEATATGWSSGLRLFNLRRFQPTTGARRPRPRYTSRPLMNSILVNPELQQIFTLGRVKEILSGTGYDDEFVEQGPLAEWTTSRSTLHHWAVLNKLADRVASGKTVKDRLDILDHQVSEALGKYTKLTGAGIRFSPESGPRNLNIWHQAIQQFRALGVT